MRGSFIILLVLSAIVARAQPRGNNDERLLTAGFQFRPIVSSKFLGAGETTTTDRIFTTTIKPKLGYSFGMIIRRGLTRTISFEGGINYFKRNYNLLVRDDSLNMEDKSDFGMVTYEIPLQMLIYVRLGERFYMNNSLGVSLNWFASDVATLGYNQRISQRSYLHRVPFNPSLLANIGFEYRTRKAGFFYLGASLDRPFYYFATTVVKYDLPGINDYQTVTRLRAATLTLDVRYFFHEQPIKKKTQVQKKKKEEKR